MPDLSDLAPILAAALFGGLFAFHSVPDTAEPQPAPTLAEILEQSRPVETCVAFLQETLDDIYRPTYLYAEAAQQSCDCIEDTVTHGMNEADIKNDALRSAIYTFVLDFDLIIGLGRKDEDLINALIAYADGKADEDLGFTANELMTTIKMVTASLPQTDDLRETLPFLDKAPACKVMAENMQAHILETKIPISEKSLTLVQEMLNRRASEYAQRKGAIEATQLTTQ